MKNTTEKLKKLKSIQPDAQYSQISKMAILTTPLAAEENASFSSKLAGNITEILKKLRLIEPNPEYARVSRIAILGAPVIAEKRNFFNWQLAFTLASLLLVLISGNLIRNLKPTAPNLNAQALQTELSDMNIDIQLAKIDYSQNIDETVSLALKEITNKQTDHLNPIILQSEQTKLNTEPADNQNIDNLLNQILL